MIYLVLLDVTLKGGIERVVTNLASYIANKGEKITVISFFQTFKRPFYNLDPNVKVVYLSEIKCSLLNNWLYTPILIKRLFKNIREFKNSSIFLYYAGMIPFLWIISPRILSFLTYSEHLSFDTAGIPVRFVRRFFLKRIKSVHVINKYSQSRYTKFGIKAEYIPNPITIFNSPYQFKQKPITLSTKRLFKIISIGRLERVKNLIDILKLASLFNEINSVQFCIYGDGPQKGYLLEKAEDLKLNNLSFNAAVEDISPIYESADFIIMPSISEALPMVLLEAMSFGVIPISYNDLNGPNDIITNRKNGFLCPRGNYFYIKKRILEIIENENKFKLLSDNAIKSSLRYSPERINNSFLNTFIKKSKS